MHEFTVGIDIDDTVCVLAREIDSEVLKRYPVTVDHNEYYLGARYDYMGHKLSAGLVRKILYNNVDWLNLPPVKEAVRFVKKLQKKGAKIIFITNRSEIYTPHVVDTTTRWLDKYFHNYEMVFTKDKLRYCNTNKVDFLIDNSHKVLLSKTADNTKLMFFTGVQPTTVKETGLDTYKSWEEIYKTILEKGE